MITLSRVGKSYGAVRAVIDVSVQFEAGVLHVIEGANGSGKSTLLGMVGTLIRPSVGTIDYGELGASLPAVRERLGWLGHESLCYPDLTGRENLELAARLAGVEPRHAWEAAVERFHVRDVEARPMRVASRGQKQRVALARALVGSPRLLLLDEPSTGLDVASTTRMVDVITEEIARGAVVVVITHDPHLLEDVKTKRFRMDRGRIREATA